MDLHILKIIPHDSSLDIFLQIDKICPQKEVFNLFFINFTVRHPKQVARTQFEIQESSMLIQNGNPKFFRHVV